MNRSFFALLITLVAVSLQGATFTVSSAADAGANTLRTAITSANATAGMDVINFTLADGATINLASALPAITERVILNNSAPAPRIVLNGTAAGTGAYGLTLRSDSSLINKLVIRNFGGRGISIEGGRNNTIYDTWIGVDISGNVAKANGTGIFIANSPDNTIGDLAGFGGFCLISGNSVDGIRIDGAASTNNRIVGNRIGTNAAGTAALGNAFNGVVVTEAPSNIIENNVISGNLRNGIALSGAGTRENSVKSNKLGTDVSGNVLLGNANNGVFIVNGGTYNSVTNGNLIAGNVDGVRIEGVTTAWNSVYGNTCRSNQFNGIVVVNAVTNRIGLWSMGNTLTQNGTNGLAFTGAQTSGNFVHSNVITSNNQNGIAIVNSAAATKIGFDTLGDFYGNTITGNGGAGIWIDSAVDHAIRYNVISGNGGLGIDLAPAGVNGNDGGDGDAGANNLQNHPVVTSAVANANGTSFTGTIHSVPNSTIAIDIFASASCDGSGYGEGTELAATAYASTDASGNGSFSANGWVNFSGKLITATATLGSNTSEFSPCIGVGGCTYGLTASSSQSPAAGGSGFVDVNTSALCDWSAVSNAGWITVTAPNGSMRGPNRVSFNVAANSGPARSGTITIAGMTYTVNQDSGCTYSLGSSSASFGPAAANGSFGVTASAGCAWGATSNAGWITITGGASGNGSGTVSYSVAANGGAPRNGTITAAGQTFTINQSSCSYALTSSTGSFGAPGGSSSFGVTATDGCPWSAASNAGWITITAGATGTGSGTVSYSVASNGGAARSGTITAAGNTFTVNQAGAADDATFVSQSVPSSMNVGQTYSVTVTMQNSGDTTWTAGALYRLGSENPGDNFTWGMHRVELPSSIAPAANAVFTFNVTAPSTPGTYNFQWRMVRDGVAWFGAKSTNVAVAVGVADVRPVSLTVDSSPNGGLSNGNSVLEAGEYVVAAPSWINMSGGTLSGLMGTASSFTGPSATYTISDAIADYGSVPSGSVAQCGTTLNCLGLRVTGTRPTMHWDATFTETLNRGSSTAWGVHVGGSFSDVPTNSIYYRFIETLLHNNITAGCGGNSYCPGSNVTRQQMAVFVALSMAGGAPIPSSGTVGASSYNCSAGGNSLFSDVAPTSGTCRFIHYVAAKNITSGCAAGVFCPNAAVPRWQMAIFVGAALVAPSGTVPLSYSDATTGRSYSCNAASPNLHFTDVNVSDSYCKFAHYIWARGIITGCGPNQYCPSSLVTREQMAVFLVTAFGLKLY